LVIFDVDDVLIAPVDKVFRMETSGTIQRNIVDELKQTLGKSKDPLVKARYERLLSRFRLSRKVQSVEVYTPHLLAKLQAQGITVIGLTQCETGKLGFIEDVPDWRIQELASLGFKFTEEFQKQSHIVLNTLPKANYPFPIFKKGILFTSGYSKGRVLISFIRHSQYYPKSLVFFDDKRYQLESVQKAAKALGLPFQGFHYLGANRLPRTSNTQITTLQKEYFYEKELWLSDIETETFINSQK